jgi:hypothetical protein
MSEIDLINKVTALPPSLKEEVSDFVDFLISKHLDNDTVKKPLKFGMMKGTFEMADDFDEPLEDFKEYMP